MVEPLGTCFGHFLGDTEKGAKRHCLDMLSQNLNIEQSTQPPCITILGQSCLCSEALDEIHNLIWVPGPSSLILGLSVYE